MKHVSLTLALISGLAMAKFPLMAVADTTNTITLTSSIDQGISFVPNGSKAKLQDTMGVSSSINVGDVKDWQTNRALIKFNTKSLREIHGYIKKATLRLYVENTNPRPDYNGKNAYISADMLGTGARWQFPNATDKFMTASTRWPGKWGILGDTPAINLDIAVVPLKEKGFVEWDVTAAVRLWQNNIQENNGIRLSVAPKPKRSRFTIDRIFTDYDAFRGTVQFASSDSPDNGLRPQLVIESETTPSSIKSPIKSDEKPTAPYRLWYVQPNIVARYPELFNGMTINTAAADMNQARWLNFYGISALSWASGPVEYGTSSQWYADNFSAKLSNTDYRWPGIANDEWAGQPQEQKDRFVAGLREARKKFPDKFIAVWTTKADPELIQLAKDNVVDLFIIEGYPFVPNSNNDGWQSDFNTTMRRVDAFAKAGVASKVIVGWGWIAGEVDNDGRVMTKDTLHSYAEEAKKRYPQMPGIGFFTAGVGFFSGSQLTPAALDMYGYANNLSKELYPDINR